MPFLPKENYHQKYDSRETPTNGIIKDYFPAFRGWTKFLAFLFINKRFY